MFDFEKNNVRVVANLRHQVSTILLIVQITIMFLMVLYNRTPGRNTNTEFLVKTSFGI